MKGLKPGNRYCVCPMCDEGFTSIVSFDKHRVAIDPKHPYRKRRCLTSEEMSAIGMHENKLGYWASSTRPTSTFEEKSK